VSSDPPGPAAPEPSGERTAFYALAPGGWRDYWTLLHPPYTVWHLSYVAMGAALAPHLNVRWLLETLLAFLLAMGVAAHALDELHGRPLRTRIPGGVLIALAAAGLAGAVALGVDGVIESTAWLALCIPAGVFLVLAYDLELFGGSFHSDLWFALAWGAFPVITAFLAQTGRVSAAAAVLAAACAALSAAQRALSSPVRRLRRSGASIQGTVTLPDGSSEPLDAAALRAAPERALRLLSLAMPLLAGAMVAARL
jgi:hypothetical protein